MLESHSDSLIERGRFFMSVNILDVLASHARERVRTSLKSKAFDVLMSEALSLNHDSDFIFEHALLKNDDIAFICECKKASPSKGLIAKDFPYLDIAREYEHAGADAISVLTEPKYFLGSDLYLKEIAENVNIPVLRKDFVVHDYMIAEAKVLGASAVLLIVSVMNDSETLKHSIRLCDRLGLSALVEAHDENEIRIAINSGARVIGVNNRNLKNFTVDFENSKRLRDLVPENIIFVAESGIKTRDDVRALRECGVNAVLIGEALMKSNDKKAMIETLRS